MLSDHFRRGFAFDFEMDRGCCTIFRATKMIFFVHLGNIPAP
ncbi:hypothetical protein L284_06285 [Novosphingobium lindaniclasticum LE124]|uniref:Uncharacterized protein n=1 Tax=Novosphingobium lindaniclasticum LE124 TaxID=1096930 RepID=T0J7S2_9SPHN|nr:hypothetical protein L284_06285 [Novosphingobium lindaniclasticum LE124]